MPPQPTPANWLSVAALGVMWGGTFMVVSIALRGYGPVTVACARTSLGALALLGLMAALGRRMPRGDLVFWGYVAAIGALSTALPFFLLSWGQQYVPSAFAGLSMAALPIFVLPLAHLFSDEPLTLRRSFGVVLGFTGAAVLLGGGAVAGGTGEAELWGRAACLAAAVSYACASVLTRRCPRVDPVALSALTLSVGALILVPAMLLAEGVPHWAGTTSGLAILFLGLFPTALAVLLRVSVIRSAGSVFLTLVNYLVPLFSMLFGAALLGEVLPPRFFIALTLILAGLAISQWRSLRRLLRPGRPA